MDGGSTVTSENEMRNTMDEMTRTAESGFSDFRSQTGGGTENIQRQGGQVLSTVESLPDSVYLGTVAGSIVLSALFFLLGRRDLAIFIGLWPPTLINLLWFLKERRPSQEVR